MDTVQTKSRLLLIDGDQKSLRVLDVSLKKAGFDVQTATSGREALLLLEAATPDLIISDTDLEEMDGFELCSRIKSKPDWTKIPFLFVSGRKSIEDKIRGLELGVDDYLTKPIYIKEIGIRVRTALQRAERERMESRREGRTRFAGDLSDVGVVDLVQTIELNRKSGIIHIVNRDGRRGSIFFRDGKVIDAEVGRLSGAHAMYRLFSWSEGQFAVEFKQIRRHDVIDAPMAPLLMEGMRRLDEATHLLERMPSPSSVLEVDCRVLAEELAELPDEMNSVLRLCDGARTLQEVIEDSDYPDLEALTIIDKLFAGQIIFAREAPSRGGEAAPGERLARWLSEGGAEDGEIAEELTGSAEHAVPQELAKGDDDLPAVTPAPSPSTPQADVATETSSILSNLASNDSRNSSSTEAAEAPTPSPSTSTEPPTPVPTGISTELSAEESLGAVLPPATDFSAESIPNANRPNETLRGIPIDNLFAEEEPGVAPDPTETAEMPATIEAIGKAISEDTPAIETTLKPRMTKPLGLAERLLSDDSSVRTAAMREAMSDQDGRVSESIRPERHTREYGDQTSEEAAALVHEVVSSTHQAKREAPAPADPEKPSKEVDWGAWGTQTESSSPGDPAPALSTIPSAPSDSSADEKPDTLAAEDPKEDQVALEVSDEQIQDVTEAAENDDTFASAEPSSPPESAGPPPPPPIPSSETVGLDAPAPQLDKLAAKPDDPLTSEDAPKEEDGAPVSTASVPPDQEEAPADAPRESTNTTDAPTPDQPKLEVAEAAASLDSEPAPSSQPDPSSTTAPSPSAPRQKSARHPSRARDAWFLFMGALSLGVVGLLALGNRTPAPSSPPVPIPPQASAPPASQPPSAPAPSLAATQTATSPPPALAKAADSTPAPAAAKPLAPVKASAAFAVDTAVSQAAALEKKCLEIDAEGKGKAKAVAAACRPALDADPDNAKLMVLLARAEIDRGHLVEGRSLAKRALATDPKRLDAYVYLGSAEQEAGRIDEARAAYKKYLELAPDGPHAKELRAILNNL